jgi:hypothetical protein
MAFVDSTLGILALLFLRSRVTPVDSPQLPEGTVVSTTSTTTGQVTGSSTV